MFRHVTFEFIKSEHFQFNRILIKNWTHKLKRETKKNTKSESESDATWKLAAFGTQWLKSCFSPGQKMVEGMFLPNLEKAAWVDHQISPKAPWWQRKQQNQKACSFWYTMIEIGQKINLSWSSNLSKSSFMALLLT